MKRLIKIVLVAVGLSFVSIALLSFHTRPANAQARSAPVTVTNTPLPVTGTVSGNVSVSNFPSSQTVNFNGTAQPVSISSNTALTPLLVRDVDRPARHPFGETSDCTIVSGQQECVVVFTVPANQLLVVEMVSAFADVGSGEKTVVFFGGDSHVPIELPMQLQATVSNIDMFTGVQLTRMYFPPGGNTIFRLDTFGASAGRDNVQASISGYLVDCSAGTPTDPCPLP